MKGREVMTASLDRFLGGFSNHGAVLVYVLWILAALSFLALQAAAFSRTRALETRWAWEELQRREAVHSWVRLTVFSEAKVAVLPLGRWVPCRLGELRFWVRRDEERSKTPVNQSDVLRVRRTVERAAGPGVEPAFVDRVVDALMDWRDPDDALRPFGAERADYERLGLPPPTNGPFSGLCEVRMVLGVSPELFWGHPLEEALRQWTQRSAEGAVTAEVEAAGWRVGLAESLSAVSGNAARLTFLFPRGERGYDIEVVVFSPTEGSWRLLDRCRGHVTLERREPPGLEVEASAGRPALTGVAGRGHKILFGAVRT
ncbi:hypothetical protein [Desulfosoma sp.]